MWIVIYFAIWPHLRQLQRAHHALRIRCRFAGAPSSKLHDAPRAGYFRPYTVVAGIDTVAVPDFDLDLLGHAYFAQAAALLHDIRNLMLHNEAPAKRQRIKPAEDDGMHFWRFEK
jgi:hypothetical protein